MGRGDECGNGVCDPDVTWWPGGSRVVGRDVCWDPSDGPLQCLQLVPSAVAAGVLGALTEGFRSDARPWGVLRRNRRRLTGAGAPDVYVVASGTRGHLKALDISLLHVPDSPRGRAAVASGQSLRGAQDRRDVPRHPEAARGAVDVCASGRGRTDQ